MNKEVIVRLFEESTGKTYPECKSYRGLGTFDIDEFAKTIVKECEKFTNKTTALFMRKHFGLED